MTSAVDPARHPHGRLDGLIAATFAPMDADGVLDLTVVPNVVAHLVRSGVRGLFVSGTTGEFSSLTIDERKRIAEAYIAAVPDGTPVLVHVGSNCLRDAQDLAAHAQVLGADAVSMAPPTYFRPPDVDTLIACCADVASAAPELSFYYYHLPRLTGVDPDMVAFLERGADRIPTLRGLKFSAPDVMTFRACVELHGGRFELLWGCDELLLTGLSSGARAAVGSTYNFAAPIYRKVIDAFVRADVVEAARWQNRAVTIVDVLLRHGGLPAIKAAMELAGAPCGPVRLPLRALDDAARAELRRDLAAVGFPDVATTGEETGGEAAGGAAGETRHAS